MSAIRTFDQVVISKEMQESTDDFVELKKYLQTKEKQISELNKNLRSKLTAEKEANKISLEKIKKLEKENLILRNKIQKEDRTWNEENLKLKSKLAKLVEVDEKIKKIAEQETLLEIKMLNKIDEITKNENIQLKLEIKERGKIIVICEEKLNSLNKEIDRINHENKLLTDEISKQKEEINRLQNCIQKHKENEQVLNKDQNSIQMFETIENNREKTDLIESYVTNQTANLLLTNNTEVMNDQIENSKECDQIKTDKEMFNKKLEDLENVLKENNKQLEEKITNLENELILKTNSLNEERVIIQNLKAANYDLKTENTTILNYVQEKDAELREHYFKSELHSNESLKFKKELENKVVSVPFSVSFIL
jgi:hypothetical protein